MWGGGSRVRGRMKEKSNSLHSQFSSYSAVDHMIRKKWQCKTNEWGHLSFYRIPEFSRREEYGEGGVGRRVRNIL